MSSIAKQLSDSREALAGVAGDQAALEARILAAHAWDMTPESLVKYADQAREAEALRALIVRRLQHEPISQIVGKKEFWREAFFVTPNVLTPRADSETIIEALLRLRLDQHAPLRMLDLGTGSGCLLLSALQEYRNATGVGVDVSDAALAVAKRNVDALKLNARVELLRSNWCSNVQGQFDVIISNPPYIPQAEIATLDADVREHEPHLALDGGADGLDCYRSILAQVAPHFVEHGLILFEVGQGQARDVAQLGRAHGFRRTEIFTDLAGIARVVVLQRI